MAKCINCGSGLNAFNETYPLWDGTHEKMCSRCKAKYERLQKTPGFAASTDFFTNRQDVLRQFGFSDSGINYLIDYAYYLENADQLREEKAREDAEEKAHLQKAREEALAAWDANSKMFMETTGFSFEGYRIAEYKGIRSGEVVLGTGFLSEFSAGINDLFGTASNSMAAKLTAAKDAALEKLKENCLYANANAVIGVDIDISIMSQNMILASANGTAVRIEKI